MYKDVIVIGAGISGISAGYNLKKSCPNKSFAILEGRESLGGTWDIFKYPGKCLVEQIDVYAPNSATLTCVRQYIRQNFKNKS